MAVTHEYAIQELSLNLGIQPEEMDTFPGGVLIKCPQPRLRELITTFARCEKARLSSVICTDDRKESGSFGLRYLFSMGWQGIYVCFETAVPQETPVFESVARVVPAASRFEREISEFFGLKAEGNPDDRGLILHEDWPAACHPLRKDFEQGTRPPRNPDGRFEFTRVEGEGVFEIPVGPVHAGIIEPGHFRFSVAGEPIINLEIRLGFVHKGIEKLAEGKALTEALPLCERISGDASFSHALAYCQAAEMLTGAQVPARAKHLRVIFAELERLYNHMGDLGGIATDVAFAFASMQYLRLRELTLRQNGELCGHRLLRGTLVPGGMALDITPDQTASLVKFTDGMMTELDQLQSLMLETDSLMDRVENTGRTFRKTVEDLGGVGPVARACGIDQDLRRDLPYAAYSGLQFSIALQEEGDVASRMRVKMAEAKESLSLIRQAVISLPEGPVAGKLPPASDGKCAIGWVESSRGEIVHFLRAGKDGRIDRLKIKSPSFVNWPLLGFAVRGDIVPDFPLDNKSFNLSYSGNDR